MTDLAFDFWYPSDVSRPYMPDPKGEAEAILRDLEAVGFKPNPKTAAWRPDYLAAEAAGKYPMLLIGWTCDWLGIDNFLYTAFFGYPGRPGRTRSTRTRTTRCKAAIDAALRSSDEATASRPVGEGPGLILADIPIGADRTRQDRRQPAKAYVKGFAPAPAT